ncbi:MAG: response regulator [Candidatus Promineifilaceae bacterium]
MRKRILLADDHAVVRAGIRKAIENSPDLEIVGEVGDGPSVVESLERLRPDCLLIDVTMPEFEPILEIRRIRNRYPHLLILVVSAYDDDVYVQGLLRAGVNGYHLKDQPLSDLQLAVERILAGERWISSPLVEKLLTLSSPNTAEPKLSVRQIDILRLLAEGADNRAIAQNLNLSIKTIENHLTKLYRQLNVQSRLEAAYYVREHPEAIAHSRETAVPDNQIEKLLESEQPAILLVDDNRRYRHQLRRTIGKVVPEAIIFEAGNISEALNLVERIAPNVIFVDVVLGDEDGIRCVRQLKVKTPFARIILISAYPDREFHRLGLQAGAAAFVDKKDLDAATLQQMIGDVVGN